MLLVRTQKCKKCPASTTDDQECYLPLDLETMLCRACAADPDNYSDHCVNINLPQEKETDQCRRCHTTPKSRFVNPVSKLCRSCFVLPPVQAPTQIQAHKKIKVSNDDNNHCEYNVSESSVSACLMCVTVCLSGRHVGQTRGDLQQPDVNHNRKRKQ